MKLCLVILGPTASGKSAFALNLAKHLGGELICLDSTTVYKEFDIGTAKPSPEDQKAVPHHLLDILNPDEEFSAFHFVQSAHSFISEIESRGKLPIIVGGTYFYLRALQNGMYDVSATPQSVVEQLELDFFEDEQWNLKAMHEELIKKDPQTGEKIHPNDQYRLVRALGIIRHSGKKVSELKPVSEPKRSHYYLKYALCPPRHELHHRIEKRTMDMLTHGLVEETKTLLHKYPKAKALESIGYKQCVEHLENGSTQKDLTSQIIEKTRQLAKRQLCWLRSDPEVRYVDLNDLTRIQKDIENLTYIFNHKGA